MNFEAGLDRKASINRNPMKIYIIREKESITGHTTTAQLSPKCCNLHSYRLENLMRKTEMEEFGWMVPRGISRTLYMSFYQSFGVLTENYHLIQHTLLI